MNRGIARLFQCSAGVLCLAARLVGQAPISLQASTPKPRTIVGESIRIDLHQILRADLDLETVELNRDQTSIIINSLDKPGETRVLSGKDYIALHHRQPLSQVGRSFHGKAGAAWTSQLNLLDYTYPLPAGRYRVAVSYRWADNAAAVVRANDVEIEVAPARLLSARFRWFGGAVARDQLAVLWAAEESGKPHWFYQVSDGLDPAAVVSAVDLGWTLSPAQVSPRIAHLNQIAGEQYERVAVWTDHSRLCWQRLADTGSIGAVSCADAGLSPRREVRLADPPLQLRQGGLVALLTGEDSTGNAQAALLRIGLDGRTQRRLIPIGGVAAGEVVAWADSEEPVQGVLYHWVRGPGGSKVLRTDLVSGKQETLLETRDEVTAITVDQWLGRAEACALARRSDSFQVLCWSPAPSKPVELPFPLAWKLMEAAPLASGQGHALLGQTHEGWAVVTRRTRWTGASSSPPHLIASPGGLFLINHDANRGFRVLREFPGE
jgi:hypothetical protein